MVQMIKDLWTKWENIKTWQQIALILPFILLTIGFIAYILFPFKPKKLEEEILEYNKKAVDKKVEEILEEKKILANKQIKHKEKRLKIIEKVKEKENETEKIIKQIDDADDNIAKLMSIHSSINARSRRNNSRK